MAIQLELRRVTPEIYLRMAAMEDLAEWTGEERRIAGDWDVLGRVLGMLPFEGDTTLARAITGSDQLAGAEDYGGTHGIAATEVPRLSAALDSVGPEEIRRLFFSTDLTGARGLDVKDDESAGWTVDAFGDLREFYQSATDAGDAVVVWLF